MSTALLTPHARARCREMGISTKVAKHIVRDADITRPDKPGSSRKVAQAASHPDYAVVFDPGEPPVVVTVLFNAPDFAGRDGEKYVREEP